jgi:hypothetical protein
MAALAAAGARSGPAAEDTPGQSTAILPAARASLAGRVLAADTGRPIARSRLDHGG